VHAEDANQSEHPHISDSRESVAQTSSAKLVSAGWILAVKWKLAGRAENERIKTPERRGNVVLTAFLA
jgi:hypothetical protein